MIKKKYILISISISFTFLFSSFQSSKKLESTDIEIFSTNSELVEVFNWSKEKARSYVQTGKSGKVDAWERGAGTDNIDYIPSYWAGYPGRSAFYSRDYCHQITGAHLLGLEEENFVMMEAFASSATLEKKWYPLWAINFDGSPYLLDYRGDNDFVREVPATFELVEKAHELYLWTGNKKYIEDKVLWNYYEKVVSDFIDFHDKIIPNGIAEGTGKGIFQGVSTYNEKKDLPLIESGDGIASQYRAYLAFSEMAKYKGLNKLYKKYQKKATDLKDYFNNEWGIKNTQNYNRGYLTNGKPIDGWGKENSWFIPMKGISEGGSERNLSYLNFINEKLESKDDIPDNIEAISYIPETYFLHHKNELGWKWMKHIMNNLKQDHSYKSATGRNGDYPEVSYVLIRNVIEDLLGVKPNAHDNSISTFSHLPNGISDLEVKHIKIGTSLVSVMHEGTSKSKLHYEEGEQNLTWIVKFAGDHKYINIDGKKKQSSKGIDNGQVYSYYQLKLKVGNEVTVFLNK